MNCKTQLSQTKRFLYATNKNNLRPKGRLCYVRVRATTTLPAEFKTITPVGNRIYVKADTAEAKSAGGLILPTSAQKMPTKGQVVSVSEGSTLKKGDHVLYGKYSGTEINVQDAAHVILKEEDVLGIMMDSSDISKLKPLNDRVLVKVSETEDKTDAGLLLTSPTKEKPTFGKVLAVGPGKKTEEGKRDPPNLKVGGTVLYSRYSGTEFDGPNDEEYIILKEGDILAQLE